MKETIFKIIVLAFLLGSFFSNTLSQINTENLYRTVPDSGLSFNAALNAVISRGNTEFSSLDANARIDYIADHYTIFTVGNIGYREGNERKIAHRGFAHIRYIHSISSWLSAESFVQKQFDAFTNLLDRNLFGLGARMFIIDQNIDSTGFAQRFMVGIGVMYENELLRVPQGYETEIPRSTNYLNYSLTISDGPVISAIAYYQPSLTYKNDWRALTTASVTFPLYKALSFISSLNYSFDNEPPQGIGKYDLEFSNGLRLAF
ncbi:MAG: hypothetical protein Kapaf2KO_12990 [Candidatus Kapaibacteriales bacterium]